VRNLSTRLGLPLAALLVGALGVYAMTSDGRENGREGAAKVPRKPPVVMIIFDELPGDALLGQGARIDAVRYPNFAALARHAYWFRNAFSAYDSTPKAVPLIMDGMRPSPRKTADSRGHPHTLFDLLGQRGYRLRVSEEATRVCPPRWCPPRGRPSIVGNLGSDRPKRLESFFRTIRPSRRPGFWLKHALLPHNPYRFMPDGSQTTPGTADPIKGLNRPAGFHDEFLTRHNEQRFLLQLAFVDSELGKLLDRLHRNRMFDEAMIVVVADHGFAFQTNVPDRRRVRPSNVEEIGPVPLFIKAPGQRRGRIDRSYVSTMDVAPTIADLLHVRLPYRADGHSAFSAAVRRRRALRIPGRDFDFVVRISGREWERRRRAVVRRRLRMFGSGASGLYDGIGPHRELVGRSVSDLRTAGAVRVRGRLVDPAELRHVRRSSAVVPVEITGNVRGGRPGATRGVAVAVNGRVEAVGRTFYIRGDPVEHFAVLVPEDSLHEGRNDVQIYEVGRRGTLRLIAGT
jgi:Sulfatase